MVLNLLPHDILPECKRNPPDIESFENLVLSFSLLNVINEFDLYVLYVWLQISLGCKRVEQGYLLHVCHTIEILSEKKTNKK